MRFAELTDRVHYTGETVIVDKQGQPFVAVVSLEDLDALEALRARQRQDAFTRQASAVAQEANDAGPTDEEILQAVKAIREAIYREHYGAA